MTYDITSASMDALQDTVLMQEECSSCGYNLQIHAVAGSMFSPDPDGGCPKDEIDAMRRWGLM